MPAANPPQGIYKGKHVQTVHFCDIGMLGAMLDLSYNDLLDQDYGMIKAFFAENFVACELKALGVWKPLFMAIEA